MKNKLFFLLIPAFCQSLIAAPSEPEWQIIKTKYPTDDVVIAGYNVEDFGAKGDGRKDCTEKKVSVYTSAHAYVP